MNHIWSLESGHLNSGFGSSHGPPNSTFQVPGLSQLQAKLPWDYDFMIQNLLYLSWSLLYLTTHKEGSTWSFSAMTLIGQMYSQCPKMMDQNPSFQSPTLKNVSSANTSARMHAHFSRPCPVLQCMDRAFIHPITSPSLPTFVRAHTHTHCHQPNDIPTYPSTCNLSLLIRSPMSTHTNIPIYVCNTLSHRRHGLFPRCAEERWAQPESLVPNGKGDRP